MLGLAGFGFLVGFGWLCPGFHVLTFLRALPPPCPFSSLQGELESLTAGRGVLPVPGEGGLGEQPHPGLGAQELTRCSRECILK